MPNLFESQQHIVNQFNNEYAAAMYVAQEARKVLTATNNAMSESEAIQWVISGKPQAQLQAYIQRKKKFIKHVKYNVINEYAAKIDDSQLEYQFRYSAIQSSKNHRLVISYGSLDPPNSVRLRILMKQYWLDHLKFDMHDTKLRNSNS